MLAMGLTIFKLSKVTAVMGKKTMVAARVVDKSDNTEIDSLKVIVKSMSSTGMDLILFSNRLRRCLIRWLMPGSNQGIPAVAARDSWNDTLLTMVGLTRSMIIEVKPKHHLA